MRTRLLTEDAKIEKAIDNVLREGGYDISDTPMSKTGDSGKDVQKSMIQYIKFEGDTYKPVGKVVLADTLQPGAYELVMTMEGVMFKRTGTKTDELYVFENSPMYAVLKEVDKFWTLKPNFDKLGYLHHRGVLLYGPPGMGKSALIHQVSERMAERGDIVFRASQISSLKSGLDSFRQIEPDRRLVVVLEDMDEYVGYQERDMLQLLDGQGSVDNVLFVGCMAPYHKILTRDLRWVSAGDVTEGTELWALDENPTKSFSRGGGRHFKQSTVTSSFPAKKQCVRVVFKSGEEIICTHDHPWLVSPYGNQPYIWVKAENLRANHHRALRPFKPWKTVDTWEAGWIAGILDGEGCVIKKNKTNYHISVGFTQVLGPTADAYVAASAKYCPISTNVQPVDKCQTQLRVRTLGQMNTAQFLGMIRPERLLRKFSLNGSRVQVNTDRESEDYVIAVEKVGMADIQSISTTSRTYFGEGFAMHNTTNYIEKFPPRLVRPGRFDKKIRIDFPPVEGRLMYLKNKLQGIEEEGRITEIAHKTQGFSFGHLRELVIGTYAFGEEVDGVIRRLRTTDYAELPTRESGAVEEALGVKATKRPPQLNERRVRNERRLLRG